MLVILIVLQYQTVLLKTTLYLFYTTEILYCVVVCIIYDIDVIQFMFCISSCQRTKTMTHILQW